MLQRSLPTPRMSEAGENGVPLPPCGGGDRGEGAVGIEWGVPGWDGSFDMEPHSHVRSIQATERANVALYTDGGEI
jgi:hypothetical protein